MTDTATLLLQAQLGALRAAYYSGASSVSYEGKSVQYMARGDMLALITSLENQLGLVTQPQRTIIRTDKGW